MSLLLLLSSCVYYNTFYNAKHSFEDARSIINEEALLADSFNQNKLPPTAKKQLLESINSSLIVIEDYPESKYIDDALFIIGNAYYLLSEFYKAEKYFNDLIASHPYSPYILESRLWIEYINLEIASIDTVLVRIEEMEEDNLQKDLMSNENHFLLHNLKGDIYTEKDEFINAINEYEKALTYLSNKSRKIKMYSKLVLLTEGKNDLEKTVKYLDEIYINTNNKETRIDSRGKWFSVMRKMNKFDEVVVEIQELLNNSDYSTNSLQEELNMELAKTYMQQGDYKEAKNVFSFIASDASQKVIRSESYYWLGYISLFYFFEIELAKEYFGQSIEERKSSKYAKKSNEILKEIDSYEDILSEFNLVRGNFIEGDGNDSEIDSQDPQIDTLIINSDTSNYLGADSLLFMIAEKLYFDFKQKELSKQKYGTIILEYPNSIYFNRSEKILNLLSNLNIEDSSNELLDSISLLRDQAWDVYENDSMIGIKSFLFLAKEYNDPISYYSLGIIHDYHIFDLSYAIDYYSMGYKLIKNEELKEILRRRLLFHKEVINEQIDSLNQHINYAMGIKNLSNISTVDSAKIYFELSAQELKNNLEKSAIAMCNEIDSFNAKLQQMELSDSILNSRNIDKDSILLELGKISFWYFKDIESSKIFFNNILSFDSTKYYDHSKYMLSQINDETYSGKVLIDSLQNYFSPYRENSEKYFHQRYTDDSLFILCNQDLKFYKNLLTYLPVKLNEIDDSINIDVDKGKEKNRFNLPILNEDLLPKINLTPENN